VIICVFLLVLALTGPANGNSLSYQPEDILLDEESDDLIIETARTTGESWTLPY
jgi:hypothetical protein